jgi:hypothetical protein
MNYNYTRVSDGSYYLQHGKHFYYLIKSKGKSKGTGPTGWNVYHTGSRPDLSKYGKVIDISVKMNEDPISTLKLAKVQVELAIVMLDSYTTH